MSFPIRPRYRLCLALLFVVGYAWAQNAVRLPIDPPAASPTFRTSAQLVLVPVTVIDHNGKTIEGLRADDFKILDGETSEKIISFSNDDAPSSVGLVLDISGSMQETLSGTKEMAQAFFGTSNPEDEFLLLTVSTQPTAIAEFTTDTASLEEDIALYQPRGRTALIDTIYLALSRMREAQRSRRALLILSDGMDNHSRYSQTELMRLALELDVQIYTIVVDGGSAGETTGGAPYRPSLVAKPWDRAKERQGTEMLEKLSDETGGVHFHVRNNAEAKQAVIRIGHALRDEYVIGYAPSHAESSGTWHRIRVKSNTLKANIHARKGYYTR